MSIKLPDTPPVAERYDSLAIDSESQDGSVRNRLHVETQQQQQEGQEPGNASEENAEMEAFIQKYGDVKVQFINPPPQNPYFTRPYALNYFFEGTLFRTKHERSSELLELFVDLVYVGVAANLASHAVEEHSWESAAKYVLLFTPAWTIWAMLKDFMNYYFNDDLLQHVFVIWQLTLLLVYDNNCQSLDHVENTSAWISVIVSYAVSGISFALMLLFYSLWIEEHRFQMRVYSICVLFTSGCWFFILLIPTFGYRGVFALCWFIVEQTTFCLSVHPWTKKMLKLGYSTALNIEHEDERLHAFYIIAMGEFLYSITEGSPLSSGWNDRLTKGISMLFNAFMLMGIYSHKDGSRKATHALRRSATTAIAFIYLHFFVIGALLIVGDAGADLAKMEHTHLEHEDLGVLLFFHVGLLIGLCGLTILALLDEDRTEPGFHKLNRYWRVGARIPVGCLMFGLTWAWEGRSIKEILWIDTMLLTLLFIYEHIVMNPWGQYYNKGLDVYTPQRGPTSV